MGALVIEPHAFASNYHLFHFLQNVFQSMGENFSTYMHERHGGKKKEK